MPTAMKNSPSSKPLNGSKSASRAWRYSDSASSTPARNVPSAMDMPTAFISKAIAMTISNADAVKISRCWVAATIRSSGSSANRPPTTMPTITAAALAAPGQSKPSAAACCPKKGIKASMGMTAKSWNSRVAKPSRPAGVACSLRSARICRAMAVDERDMPMAAITATCQSMWKASARATSRAVVANTCQPPSPKIGRRISHSRWGASSSPTRNSMMTTPNSAKCIVSSPSAIRPSPAGPIASPASR